MARFEGDGDSLDIGSQDKVDKVPHQDHGDTANNNDGPSVWDPQHSIAQSVPAWALDLLDIIDQAGYEGFFVGGMVRDALLGQRAHDVDIACSAPWEKTKAAFVAHGMTVVETGTKHGTITVLAGEAGDKPVEITTYRVDGAYSDGRHPDEVRFVSSIEDDLSRRDFTINAMAWNPQRGLIDPFGGQDDLAAGVIRCVGDAPTRFSEDGLRILRGMRFASKLGFKIEAQTDEAIRSCISCIDGVSGERIGSEFDGLVAGTHAPQVLRAYTQEVAYIVPEIKPMIGFDQHSRWHIYDVWEHCLHALEALDPNASTLVRHVTLLHDIGKPECYTVDERGHGHFYGHEQAGSITARSVFRRLRWRSLDIDHACLLIRVHDRHIDATPRGVLRMLARLGRAYTGADAIVADLFRELLQVKRADTIAHAPSSVASRLEHLDKVEEAFNQVLADHCVFRIRDLDISGRDVMQCGVPHGPQVGYVLRALLSGVIEGTLTNQHDELIRAAQEEARKLPPL